MQNVLLIFERTALHLVAALAREARLLGVASVLVAPKGATVPGAEAFQQIFGTEKWDLETLKGFRDKLAGKYEIKGITTIHGLFNPEGLLGANVAELAAELGLPNQGKDALFRCNNKFLMRDALRSRGVPTVDFGVATDETSALEHANRIGFPVILKPLAGVASNFILKCRNAEEVKAAFALALKKLPGCFYSSVYSFPHSFQDRQGVTHEFDPKKCMLVEGYIDGREASVECIVADGEIQALMVHDKTVVTEEDRVVYEDILVTPPVRFSDAEVKKMKDYAIAAVKAIGVNTSLCHVELRYDASGPQLLEVNPRVGGMCVINSLKTILGFDARRAQAELALGRFDSSRAYPRLNDELHAMYALYPRHGGVLNAVSGMESVKDLPGMLEAEVKYPIGAKISGDDEECFLITCWMRGKSYEQVVSNFERTQSLVRYRISA